MPTDGGEHATAAARHAFDLAATCGATVHALYVVDTETSRLAVSKADVRDGLREVGGDEILASAEAEDADLIAIGTHDHEGIARRLVGGVAERIVRESPVPALTVRAEGDSD